MQHVAMDTETELIGKGAVTPDFICASFSTLNDQEGFDNALVSEMSDGYREFILELLRDKSIHLIFHNAQYDLRVISRDSQEVMDAVWQALIENRIHCTLIRELLLNLYEWGNIDTPNGRKALYDLALLQKNYLGQDRSADKAGGVRTTYSEVRSLPVEEWPVEYVKYAIDDTEGTLQVFYEQEEKCRLLKERIGYDAFIQESFRVQISFALSLMTETGLPTDPEMIKKVTKEFEEKYYDPELVTPLVEAGIVIPATPAMPMTRIDRKTGEKVYTKAHLEGCNRKKGCNCPPKMKMAQKETTSEKTLHAYVWKIGRSNPDMELWINDSTRKNIKLEDEYSATDVIRSGNVLRNSFVAAHEELPDGFGLKLDKDWMSSFAHLDPLLTLFETRKKLQKMITSYIPRMYWTDEAGNSKPTDRIHADFECLKETGRTSSRSTKLYPSWNGQQVDPRIRGCAVAEDGHLLVSIDYNGMELGTTAQKCLDLYGESVLAEVINSGRDSHTLLGAQIAKALDPDFNDVAEHIRKENGCSTHLENVFSDYDLLMSLKGDNAECDSPMFLSLWNALYKDEGKLPCTWGTYYYHFRKFAKPTGLGYPGGLGPKTFIQYARATYGIVVDMETATLLRDIWRETFPSIARYLSEHVSKNSFDPHHMSEQYEDEDGKSKVRKFYYYDTPMGLHRPRMNFCSCANGGALQSPSAEGALSSVIEIQRLCYTTNNTILSRVGKPTAPVKMALFIHDEVIGQFFEDESTQKRIAMVQSIMKKGMEFITPRVKAGTEAAAMRRWSKYAEPVHDANGNLIAWEPREK